MRIDLILDVRLIERFTVTHTQDHAARTIHQRRIVGYIQVVAPCDLLQLTVGSSMVLNHRVSEAMDLRGAILKRSLSEINFGNTAGRGSFNEIFGINR